MGAYFIFTIKTSVCLIAFYLFYKLLLGRETFHRFNRLALLGMIFFSMTISVVKTTTEHVMPVNRSFMMMENYLKPQLAETPADTTWTVTQMLFVLYMLGVAVFVVREFFSVIRLRKLFRQGRTVVIDNGVRLVVLDEDIAPFSWFRHIVISRKDYDGHRNEIVAHELAHITRHHSLDIAFCNLFVIAQWFNPVAWLLKRELQSIHEFEADEAVINGGVDATQYQMLLIRKSVGDRLFSMANSLNHHSLKRRILMMTVRKSNPWSLLRYLYMIPVAAVAIASFASPKAEQVSDRIESESNEIARQVTEPVVRHLRAPDNTAVGEKVGDMSDMPSVDPATGSKRAKRIIAANKPDTVQEEEKLYTVVEKMPRFAGGPSALLDYLSKKLIYPKSARINRVQGRVIVTFVVSKEGRVEEVRVVKSVNPDLDDEAMRVVRNMPYWIPGEQGGDAVNVAYTIPVTFRLPQN